MSIDGKSIKSFFFYNVEKIILGGSVVLLALFFYLGLQSSKFEETPDSLVAEANRAASFIENTSNWDLISEYRLGDTDLRERIERDSSKVDPSKYKIAATSIIPKALQLRADPVLPKVVELEAKVIRATVAVKSEKGTEDSLFELPVAKPQLDPDEEANDLMAAEMLGPSDEELQAMEAEAEAFEDMLAGGQSRRKKKKKKKEIKDPQDTAEVDAWSGLPGVQQAVAGGLIPARNGISIGNAVGLKRNVVVVNALVEHRQLWKTYEQTLSNSVAYYPRRDLPQYEFLQVERRRIRDGQPGPWADVSEWINFEQAEWSPPGFVSAPEIVPPEAFDRTLTNSIPAILAFDYRDYVIHSKLDPRIFLEINTGDEEVDARGVLAGEVKPKEDEEETRFGLGANRKRRRVKPSLVQGGVMDIDMMDMDMTDDMTGMMEMFGANRPGRSSRNMMAYAEYLDPTVEPAGEYKAVRFFDMRVEPNEKAEYQYRVRLWLKDPNATDPEATVGGSQFGADDMAGMMGPGGRRKKGDKVFTKTEINFTMQDQNVRERLKWTREEKDENGDPVYYVSEIYPGQDMPTEVRVPEDFEYLRFSRPTQWSEPVTVTVNGPQKEFFTDSVEEPRTARVGEIEVPVEEPKAELVAKVESKDYNGIDVAAKKLFATGDIVNFVEPITVMHPLALSVHFMEEAKFETNATLVDVMGGERLEIPRNEPVQYDLPGDVLLMTPDGQFMVSNDIEDRSEARHALRLPDEKAEYGKRKKRKPNNMLGPGGMGLR